MTTEKKTICVLILLSCGMLPAGEPEIEALTLSKTGAVTAALEHGDWAMVDSFADPTMIPELIDSLKKYYGSSCHHSLADKIAADFYNGLGIIFYRRKDDENAMRCFAAACTLCEKYDYLTGIIANRVNCAATFFDLGDTTKAIESLAEACWQAMIRHDLFSRAAGSVKYLARYVAATGKSNAVIGRLQGFLAKEVTEYRENLAAMYTMESFIFIAGSDWESAATAAGKAGDLYHWLNDTSAEMTSAFWGAQASALQGRSRDIVNRDFAQILITSIANKYEDFASMVLETWMTMTGSDTVAEGQTYLLFDYLDSLLINDPAVKTIRANLDYLLATSGKIKLSVEQRLSILKKDFVYYEGLGDSLNQIIFCELLAAQYFETTQQDSVVRYLAGAMQFCLKTHDWDGTYDALSLARRLEADSAVLEAVARESDNWSRAAIKTIRGEDLEQALHVFEQLNDSLAMARVYWELGFKWRGYEPARAEQYFWQAFVAALAGADTAFAQQALLLALDEPHEPSVGVEAFEQATASIKDQGLLTNRWRGLLCSNFSLQVDRYYENAIEILQACEDTAEFLDDPHGRDIELLRTALEKYSSQDDTTSGNTTSYGPVLKYEGLGMVKGLQFRSLKFYLDNAVDAARMRGTDKWCTNFLRELKAYGHIGWGNVWRSYVEHEARKISAELKPVIQKADAPSKPLEYLDLFFTLTESYKSRALHDSLMELYVRLQESFEGKVYQSIPFQQRSTILNLVAPSARVEDPRLANLLKFDLFGFADRTVVEGLSIGSYAEERIGKPKAFYDDRIVIHEVTIVMAEPVRFNYIDTRYAGNTSDELRDVADIIDSWTKNLCWSDPEYCRWQALNIMLRTEAGNFRKADSLLQHCLNIDSTSRWLSSVLHLARGNVNEYMGHFQSSMLDYRHAERQGAEIKEREFLEACIAGNAGNLKLKLGDYTGALQTYQKVLETTRTNPEWNLLSARARLSMGNVKLIESLAKGDQSKLDTALNYYKGSIAIMGKNVDLNTHLIALLNMAIAEHLLGRTKAADSLIAKVLVDANNFGLSNVAASGLTVRGYFEMVRGDPPKALTTLQEARENLRYSGDQPGLGKVLTLLGSVSRKLGRLDSAYAYLKESIEIFESIRAEFESGDITAAFTEANLDRYGEMVGLLVQMNRSEEAFSYIERSKSKSLRDAFDIEKLKFPDRQLGDALREATLLDHEVVKAERELDIAKSLTESPDSAKIKELTSTLAEGKAQFLSLETKIRKINPDYEALIRVTPGQLAKVQQMIPGRAVFLEYYAAPEAIYIFAVTDSSFKVQIVKVKRDSLYALVKKFRELMHEAAAAVKAGEAVAPLISITRTQGHEENGILREVLTVLYSILLEPMAHEISLVDEVVIIPSGLLSYLPFHALARETKGGLKFFIEEKRVSYLTSAELIDIVKDKIKRKQAASMLGFANPDGSLPAAEAEVNQIMPFFRKASVFTLGQATEEKAVNLSNNYNVLHFATHAVLDDRTPDDSYIQLAEDPDHDGKWRMSEIFAVEWDRMDLVVLSACETALGEKEPSRDIATLAYAFSVAGTPSIIASLWPVYDPSTRDLMRVFYGNLQKEDKARALQAGQRSLLQNPQYAHPFFWAPFILIGEWR